MRNDYNRHYKFVHNFTTPNLGFNNHRQCDTVLAYVIANSIGISYSVLKYVNSNFTVTCLNKCTVHLASLSTVEPTMSLERYKRKAMYAKSPLHTHIFAGVGLVSNTYKDETIEIVSFMPCLCCEHFFCFTASFMTRMLINFFL